MRVLLLAFFIFVSLAVIAQPGGGGGLTIISIRDERGNPLNDKKDFLIYPLDPDLFLHDPSSQPDIYQRSLAFSRPDEKHFGGLHIDSDDTFLLMIHGPDTMIIFFSGLHHYHPAGHTDRLDPLVFQKGCYRYFPEQGHRQEIECPGWLNMKGKKSVALRLTMAYLALSVNASVADAQRHLADAALFIEKPHELRVYYELLWKISDMTGDDWMAYAYYKKYSLYKTEKYATPQELDLLLRLKKWKEASALYDMNCEYNFSLANRMARAYFHTHITGRSDWAVEEYRSILRAEKKDAWYILPSQHSEFSDVHYHLAEALYLLGDRKESFEEMMKALHRASNEGTLMRIIRWTEEKLRFHPDEGLLYLAHAVASARMTYYISPGDARHMQFLAIADQYFSLAGAYDVPYLDLCIFRADYYRVMKAGPLAVEWIEKALATNQKKENVYFLKYQLLTQFYPEDKRAAAECLEKSRYGEYSK